MPTLSSDPIDILIASDAWCTRMILTICGDLTHEQFHQKFPIGLGSLHDTLTHVISTMRRWTDRLAGRTPRPMLHALAGRPGIGEAKDRSVDELRSLLDEAERDMVATMKAVRERGELGTTIEVSWPGADGVTKSYTFSRGAVIVHVTTHGYHHRAQCLNMLRQLGAPVPGVSEKYPEASAVDWQAATESPAAVKTP